MDKCAVDEHVGGAGRVAGQAGEVQQGDEVVRGRRDGEVGVGGECDDLGGIVEHHCPGARPLPLPTTSTPCRRNGASRAPSSRW